MLNSKLYNPDSVWAFLQDLWVASTPGSDIKWSFSELCTEHGLHQVYGTVIVQETDWPNEEGEWKTIAPRRGWIPELISRVKNYSVRAQKRHEDKRKIHEIAKEFDNHLLNEMSISGVLALMVEEGTIKIL